MPTNRHVDVAILGAGTAGLNARRAAKKEGASVLLIDSGPFGTTCARVGCMPSKLLIAAANAAHKARKASMFGLEPIDVKIDGKKVLQRVQAERDRFVGFVKESIENIEDADELLKGRATIIGEGKLHVTGDGIDEIVEYDKLVIATGTSPFVPPPFRDIQDRAMTNEHIFEMEDLPESLLVIGIGVIGIELGQAMHRLGVRTTLLGVRGVIGPLSDPDMLENAKKVFTEELDMHPNYRLTCVEINDDDQVRIVFVDDNGKMRDETFEHVLLAAGRRSTLHHLGLENVGITPDDRGNFDINPNTLQLGDAPIFVAGDVNLLHPLLHEAADDGRFAGQNAATFPEVHSFDRRESLGVVFSSPQIGTVGKRWSDLQDRKFAIGQVSYHNQGRARVDGNNKGLVRIYGDPKTGKLLGAELFGPSVEHTSHLLAWAMQQNMDVETALTMPFYHPVVEEGIRTALQDLASSIKSGDIHTPEDA